MTAGGLIIRCDANTDIGAGHFFRQLALAEAAIERGLDAVIVMHRPPAAYPDIAAESDVEVRELSPRAGTLDDAAAIQQLVGELEAAAVVVDGYHFDTSYYDALSTGEFTLAAVDDIAHQRFPVDVLVNVNPHAAELDYDVPAETRMLLGVDYALLRRQFRETRNKSDATGGPHVHEKVSRVLVTMGGGDATNETGKVLEALRLADFNGRIDVVVGPSHRHLDHPREFGELASACLTLHTNVCQMADLMNGQHLAICPAGGTSWELACLGVPMVQLVVADNQRDIASWLRSERVSRSLGWHENREPADICRAIRRLASDPAQRRRMIERGMELVDGNGPQRVLDALVSV